MPVFRLGFSSRRHGAPPTAQLPTQLRQMPCSFAIDVCSLARVVHNRGSDVSARDSRLAAWTTSSPRRKLKGACKSEEAVAARDEKWVRYRRYVDGMYMATIRSYTILTTKFTGHACHARYFRGNEKFQVQITKGILLLAPICLRLPMCVAKSIPEPMPKRHRDYMSYLKADKATFSGGKNRIEALTICAW